MTFKIPVISSNFGSQSSYQKIDPTSRRLPAAFHLLPYYARRNELSILRELHAKLSDPKKKLHQKMLKDAIMREQIAIRGYGGHNNQYTIIKQNTNNEIKKIIQRNRSNLGKPNQKQTNSDKNDFQTVNLCTTNVGNGNGSEVTSVIVNSTKEKVTRKRKFAKEAPSGLDLVENLNSLTNQKIGEENNIITNSTTTNFSTNNISAASSSNTLKYFQLDLTQGQNSSANQQMPPNMTTIPSFNFIQMPQLNPTTSQSNSTISSSTINIEDLTKRKETISSSTINIEDLTKRKETISSSTINIEDLAKRKENFIKEATSLYNNKYRILSHSVYDFYIKRLKITQNLDPRILLKKDLEIKSKFELAMFTENGKTVERLVENGKLHRKLVTIEEVFDIIHEFHNSLGHGKKMAISNALKQEYANITLNFVLLYMSNCKECYIASKNSKTLNNDNMIETGSSSDFQREISSSLEEDDVTELKISNKNYIDYTEHFLIGQNDIRCKYCQFIYLTNSNKKQRKILKSHLLNYHKKLYNEINVNGNINDEDEDDDDDDFDFLNENESSQ